MIYNQRDLMREGGIAALRTLESSSREALENWEEGEELVLGRSPRIDLYPSTTPLTILLPNDPTRSLMKSSLSPSSWARFFTKFIVLGLLGLGYAHIYSGGPIKSGPYNKHVKVSLLGLVAIGYNQVCSQIMSI